MSERVEYYRRQAALALEKAKIALNQESRKTNLAIADAWMEMAQQAKLMETEPPPMNNSKPTNRSKLA